MPAATPVTVPVDDPTVAMALLLVVHDPPAETSVRFVDDPTHTKELPDIEDGTSATVSVVAAPQPVASV